MHPFDEMKAWIGFTEQDVARLARLAPYAEPHLERLSDLFYDRILANPDARRVFSGPEQVARLKVTIVRWARELLNGPHDTAYFERRQRIGHRHVEVGLSARYMSLAMSVYRERLCAIAHSSLSTEEGHATCTSVGRACDLDLAIMTTTYVRGREVRQLETLQEVVISHLHTSALVIDERGSIVAATPGAAQLLTVEDPLGSSWETALDPHLLSTGGLKEIIRNALHGDASPHVPSMSVRIGEDLRQYRVWVVPLAHANARVLLQLDDITDSIAAEARAQRAESLAQIGALSAAVAHELRNPLAGISGAIQVISRSMGEDDRRKPIMDKVEQQVRRLDAMVNDLLAFSRPNVPELVRMDIGDVARTVVDLVSREAPRCRIAVEGAGTALADPALLQQVLLNLVQNAVQAQDGDGLVIVRAFPGHIDVIDDGPGVPEQSRDRIFDPFYTTRAKGTGLGLAICRKHAQAMGGTVQLAHGPLRGACFRVSLKDAPALGAET